jgi:ABC-2 type transport system permease protein
VRAWLEGGSRLARAVPALFRIGFAGAVAYRSEFLIWILSTNMPLVMLVLWSQVGREGPMGGFDEKEFVTYFVATFLVRLMTGSWVVWELNMEIRQGTLAMRLLRPMHPFFAYAADNIAAIPLRALFAFPIGIAVFFAASGRPLESDALGWLFVSASVAGAWALTFFAMAFIGSLGFFWESSLSAYDLWLGLFFVLSGYIVPLALFPPLLRSIADALPFRYALSLPVELLLGHLPPAAAATALGVQWAYVFAFATLAIVTFQRGLRRFSAFGG